MLEKLSSPAMKCPASGAQSARASGNQFQRNRTARLDGNAQRVPEWKML